MKRFFLSVALIALAACQPAPQTPAPTPATTTAPSSPEAGGVSVLTPHAGQSVTSPLVVTGIAPANWYFEAVFPVQLVDSSGGVIAEAPAQAQSDWTQPGPKSFRAELTFTVTQATQATLVLEQDQSGEGNPAPQTVRVPVTLAP
ncbi:MAG: Gmad2 immunoglobulin-like domain-containing protein [Pseudomonadota bacterium]